MLADMHCHYPMHLAAQAPKRQPPGPAAVTAHEFAKSSGRPGWVNEMRAEGLKLAANFLKPTLAGIETAGDLASLVAPLEAAYGEDAAMILAGNAIMVAETALGGGT